MDRKLIFLLLLLVPLLLPQRAESASKHLYMDGFRIYSSGSYGTVKITDNVTDGRIKAVAVQPWDGKIIIGGTFTVTSADPPRTMHNLARLNLDGTIDPGFAPEPNKEVDSIVVQMNQSDQPVGILVGGKFDSIGGVPHYGLVRLNDDGSVDGTFDPHTVSGTRINAIALAQEGTSIVIGGFFTLNSCGGLARIAAGDGAFGHCFTDGTTSGVANGEVNAIVIQENGKVVAGGSFETPAAYKYLIRFDEGGSVDESFQVHPNGQVRALALQVDWGIVMGGWFTRVATSYDPDGKDRNKLARVTNDGVIEDFNPSPTGDDAVIATPSPTGEVAAIAIQPDGRIVVGGAFTRIAGKTRRHVARLNLDGTLDETLDPDVSSAGLNTDGSRETLVSDDATIEGLALQQDEKILVGGRFATVLNAPSSQPTVRPVARTMLARFYSYGTLDDDVAKLGKTLYLWDDPPNPPYVAAFRLLQNGHVQSESWAYRVWSQDIDLYWESYPDWTLAYTPFWEPFTGIPATMGPPEVWFPMLDDRHVFMGGAYTFQGYNAFEGLPLNVSDGKIDRSLPLYTEWIKSFLIGRVAYENVIRTAAEAPDGYLYEAGALYPQYDEVNMEPVYGPLHVLMRFGEGTWANPYIDPPDSYIWPPLHKDMPASEKTEIFPEITAMLIEPARTKEPKTKEDNFKIILGTKYGTIFRVFYDGTVDDSFEVQRSALVYKDYLYEWESSWERTYRPFPVPVTSLSFDRNGQIIAAGGFDYSVEKDGRTWHPNVVRLSRNRTDAGGNPIKDGTIDKTFLVEAAPRYAGWPEFMDPRRIYNLNLMTDGSMIVTGCFDGITGTDGNSAPYRYLARITPEGNVDTSFDLGLFLTSASEARSEAFNERWIMTQSLVTPDAKLMVAGQYGSVEGDPDRFSFIRVSLETPVTQEVKVSSDGKTLTWKRGGGSPELKRALFYNSADGVNWTLLGDAVRVDPDTWVLDNQSLGESLLNGKKGWNQTRYIKARGLMAGDRGGGEFQDMVKAYYLKAPVTVSPQVRNFQVGSTITSSDFTQLFSLNDGSGTSMTDEIDRKSFRGNPLFSTTATPLSSAGPYPVTTSINNFSSWKYNFSAANSTLNLVPKLGTITVTADPQTKLYGDPDPYFSYSYAGVPEGTVTFKGALTRTNTGKAVGSYTIEQGTLAMGDGFEGYTIDFKSNTLTITPRPATVAPLATFKIYRNPDPALAGTLSNFVGEDNITVSYAREAGENVGLYPITATLSSSSGPGVLANYNITKTPVNFEIRKRAATVTPTEASKTYGDLDPAVFTGTASGFYPDDKVTASYSRTAGENVGSSCLISATLAPAGVLGNYDITYKTAPFTINKRNASVTPMAAGKVYGDADPVLTGTLTNFVAADKVTATYSRTPGTTAGSYLISAALSATGDLNNYNVTSNTANFTIARKAASVTAEAAGKVYGGADPALSTLTSGFLTGDLGEGKLTFSATRVSGEDAGSYDITPAATPTCGALLDNYDVQYLKGAFTISPAPLTITAQNKSRLAAQPNPELTVQYSGFVGTDGPESLGGSPQVTTSADLGSHMGSYPIVASLGSITSTNYAYSFVDGVLTITGPSPQSITFNPLRAKTYGDGEFDPGAKASSNLPVAYASSASGVASVVGGMVRVLAPGSAEITASQAGNEIYEKAQDAMQPLTVNPPPWNGLGFDGVDDTIRVADAAQLNFGTKEGFTLETWLQVDGSQPDGTGLISKGSGGAGYQLLLHQNRVAAAISNGSSSFGVPQGLVGATPLNDGQWHHVALAVDRLSATARLYLDGRVEAELSDPALAASPDNTDPLLIGVDGSGSRYFKGNIDELRLWDLARSMEEIRGAVSQIIDPAALQHLVAYYHFDEGDVGLDNALFPSAPERTAHAAHGSLHGFALSGAGSNWVRSGAFIPLLETAAVSRITQTGASSGAVVYPNYYDPTEVGLCWGSSPNPGLADSCVKTGSGAGSFTQGISGLSPGVTYHLRAYARNLMGTAFGNDLAFQTPTRLSQSITFALTGRRYGDPPFSADGTSSSGLTVSYASSNPAVATVIGGEIRINGAGSTVITASQGGDSTWLPAEDVPVTLEVAKAPITVTAADQSRPYLAPDPPFTASYQGFLFSDTSAVVTGIPVFSTSALPNSPVGSYPIMVDVTPLSAANYSFTPANGTLTVGKAAQAITFNPLRAKTYGDADFDPGATASSNLPVGYASSDPAVASVAGNKIRVLAPGSAELTASQGGDHDYLPAADIPRTLVVNPPPWIALDFDGVDDLVRIEDAAQLNFGNKGGVTMETWLRLNGSQPDGTGILSKGGIPQPGAPSSGGGYQLLLQQDRIAAEISDGSSSFGIAQGMVGTTSLNDGQWHHVALSLDRSSALATLYLDGRVEAQLSDPALSINPDSSVPLLLGVDRSGARFFRGEMDELRLWDVARSRDEIRGAVSQIVDPASQEHLVAYYHFDQGDASLDNQLFANLPDRTPYGADGKLQQFALSGTVSNWVYSGAFLPLLETSPITGITSTGAISGGTVYPNYYPATEVGLCWGSAPNPALGGSCLRMPATGEKFTGAITGLTVGTTYHLRAFAINRMGIAYGNDLIFQAGMLGQSITLAPIDKTYGDPPFLPAGRSSSGLPVSYSSSDAAVATVVNGEIRITGAGSTTITASQSGNGSYAPAPDLPVTMTVAKAPLQVMADHKARAYRTANPPLTASYAGFAYSDDSAAISGSPVLATSAVESSPVGSYPIVVGLGTLSAANYRFVPVEGTLTVLKSCTEIVFPPITEKTYGDPSFQPIASACSGISLSFASSNPQVAQVTGNLVTITGAGSTVITASGGGSGNVGAPPDVSQPLVIHKSGQAITFPPIPSRTLGDPPFTPGASASSGLPVGYRSSDPTVASVSGGSVTLVGAGVAVITAIQEGNANFNAALPASQPLTVSLEGTPPTLTLSTLTSGAVTADPVLNVSGWASDPSGIASLTVNGVDLTGRAELFSGAVPLLAGDNLITVDARDGVGNRGSETVRVRLDASAPAITVLAPADNSVTNAPLFTASGRVSSGSAVAMEVNGASRQNLLVTEGGFTGSGYLEEGVNTVEFTAFLGNRWSKVKRTVTLAPGLPVAAITDPPEDLRTEQGSVLLRGVAGDPASAATVLLDVGGSIFTPAVKEGSFQQQVTLSGTGETRISASVTDSSSGNSSVAFRNVIRVNNIAGDLNLDGRVDIADALAALRISVGLDPVTPQALAHADVAPLVDGVPQPDGCIDVGDVVAILRKIVGLAEF